MKWTDYINEEELRRSVSVLKDSGELFEVRIVGGRKKEILSGYFKNTDDLLRCFDSVDVRGKNVYITINAINESVYSREQHDRFVKNPATTNDTEVTRYKWLFVDLDPVRPAGISSSDDELHAAEVLMYKVRGFLTEFGFGRPVSALSGNGYHLFYRIDLENSEQNVNLVKDCLYALSEKFNTDRVKIDVTNSNPSRICKLHGTLAQKGASTSDRPHRMSKIIDVPEISTVSRVKLERLAALKSRIAANDRKAESTDFDLESWLSKHGITYGSQQTGRDSVIYPLDVCPFDSSHTNGDAKIFKYNNGAIAFKCHHNSCNAYHWQDLRLKFEPDAYDSTFEADDSRIAAGYAEMKLSKNTDFQKEQSHAEKKPRVDRQLKKAADLMQKELTEPVVYVGVGNDLPMLVEGTCILSAKPKLGKSWLALSMCIAIANGTDFLGYKTKQSSVLYLDLETSEQLQQKRLRKALNGAPVPDNFYIDTETDGIDNGFVEQIESYLKQDANIGVVIVDVFQIIRSASKNSKETEYDHAYRDISPLNQLANKYHISIILVCHDRKVVDPEDPFSNILGSTGLQGAATQMIVMYKPKKDSPIHVSIKGKTIDGLPEMNVSLDEGQWSLVGSITTDDESARIAEYEESEIREAVIRVAEYQEERGYAYWRGKAGEFIAISAHYGIGLAADAKEIGGFLTRNIGLFKRIDNINIQKIKNGNASTEYKISKSLLITIDDCIDYFE